MPLNDVAIDRADEDGPCSPVDVDVDTPMLDVDNGEPAKNTGLPPFEDTHAPPAHGGVVRSVDLPRTQVINTAQRAVDIPTSASVAIGIPGIGNDFGDPVPMSANLAGPAPDDTTAASTDASIIVDKPGLDNDIPEPRHRVHGQRRSCVR